MNAAPVIVVAGLGRCGSSLTMQMLSAGGVPCVGEWPAFEVDELNHRAVSPKWLGGQRGRALKLLNPHLTPLPSGCTIAVIWLDRDPQEQTSSQLKFARALFGLPEVNRSARRRWANGLKQEREEARRALSAHRPVGWLDWTFERLIDWPGLSAERFAAFALPWARLDLTAAAGVVRERHSGCYDGLLEVELLKASAA